MNPVRTGRNIDKVQVVTIGLSAFLLFSLQPMIVKMMLPMFGGGASIWLTAMVFFQSFLLLAHIVAHFFARACRPVYQVAFYLLGFGLCLFFIPLTLRSTTVIDTPLINVFSMLFMSAGIPYFILSTTNPMVQSWIASYTRSNRHRLYALYGVSNLGSLSGLLCYPLFIESHLKLSDQLLLWTNGFWVYACCLLWCSLSFIMKTRITPPVKVKKAFSDSSRTGVKWRNKTQWTIQAIIPSAALIALTNHITMELVNFPLLWVIPLCFYLLSFVICFLMPGVIKPSPLRTLTVLLTIGIFTISQRGEMEVILLWKVVASITCLFALSIYFHGNLERLKPEAKDLTIFYLHVATGGCVGGLLSGVAAPLLFKSNFELYIILVISVYMVIKEWLKIKKRLLRYCLSTAMVFILLVAFFNEELAYHHDVIYKTRSFYGTYVIRQIRPPLQKDMTYKILSQGTTIHGGQARDNHNKLYPISYYHNLSAAGSILNRFDKFNKIGIVGLGAGSLALYGRHGQDFDFFEIDQKSVEIAYNNFENLSSSQASIHIYVGDARIELSKQPDEKYDLLIFDAFNGSSIPTHLITNEAILEYSRVLKPDGLILYHISNWHVDLLPILNCAASKAGFHLISQYSTGDLRYYTDPARWAVLTFSDQVLQILAGNDPSWKPAGNEKLCWDDDFNSLWPVIRFNRSQRNIN